MFGTTGHIAPHEEQEATACVSGSRLSYEDQLYVWCLLIQNNLAGKLSPAVRSGEGARAPIVYDLLVPDTIAVAEINAVSDVAITVKHLPAIVKQFRHLEPPYSSIPPNLRVTPKKRGRKSWKERRLVAAN